MGGAHGDVYAVFDYAPDTVLLTKSRGEDAEYDDDAEDDAESGFTRWPTLSVAESPKTDNDDAIEDSGNEEDGTASGGGQSPTVPAPRGRPGSTTQRQNIGFPKTNTIGADSILSTSPSAYKRRIETGGGKPPRLHFDDIDPRENARESSPGDSGQSGVEEGDKTVMEQMYPAVPALQSTSGRSSGHVGGGLSGLRSNSLSFDPGFTGEGGGQQKLQEPAWVKGLGEMLKRMEERQERIEGMLKMGPGEGD